METQPLTEYEEKELVPVVARGLAAKRGRHNAVTNKYICEKLTDKGYKIDGIRLRKVVNYIRIKGIVKCLIATSNGYYVAENRKQIEDYTATHQRAGGEHSRCACGPVRPSLCRFL